MQCGDDSGWSAATAEAEKHLARAGVKIPADALSAVDCCPECFWELVTGKEPTQDLLPTMLRRGWGIDNLSAGKYGPHDDTSPGDENYVRQLEEDGRL